MEPARGTFLVSGSPTGHADGPEGEASPPGPPLLSARTRDEAEELIESIFIPHQLETKDVDSLDLRMRFVDSPRLTIGRVAYGSEVRKLCPPMETFVHLNLTLAGKTIAHQGKHVGITAPKATAVVFNQDEEFSVRWAPRTLQYAMRFPIARLEEHLALMTGRPSSALRFDLAFDTNTPAGHALVAAVEHTYRQRATLGTSAPRMLVDQLDSYLYTHLLLTAEHSHSAALRSDPLSAGRRHVRRACELLEADPATSWSTTDIAKRLNISERALQAGFRAQLGLSPMAFLRGIRLQRVRAQLLASDGSVSVSEIARRWGFHHLGRFSAYYRDAFGEVPSRTVQRPVPGDEETGGGREA